MPLPCLRTLRRNLENFKFESGISNEMFQFLKFKASSFQNTDKECGLVLDEMSITPKIVYDSSTNTRLGNITFPNQTGIATHILTFMIVGTVSRWKHVVGYFYIGDSFEGEVLKDIIFQIIKKTDEIGLRINYVTSDMGPGNMKLWNCGINAGRNYELVNYIPHPCDSNRLLYFIADVHLLKNLKESLINNKIFFLPEDFVIKYNLPSNKVEIAHFLELIKSQEDLEFLLTPRLHINDIQSTNTFSKMKVSKAKKCVFN